ncbi:sensor domain-containing diguanylate cyclase [Aliarcobacter cryaerophilus]|uniref:sensor domain-containing diguanylate cyclase n=1 Tax=Aliarcobacter cryaerophilus TaxID=28198 RepID=UPI0021B1FA52|nr:diguanylate cyclase [Aliarcobacter cryaerophilus]MCT7463816.1 diguanylate cyclase [Aliarcobacter cryaerophilus]MCT7467663.1 diguanylate cyclase [Aliarcobacter cryaerophilus]MCT7481833.1 diguanylate cyclase [Aliarcobacter cryaerophilus]
MEKKLVNFIKYAPMIFIPLVVFLVFYLIITGYKSTLNSNFEIYKKDLIDKQKSLVKTNIQIATQIFENQVFLTENKEKAYKSFLNLIKNINNKASDYYFIFNTKGDVIVHSFLSHLEGQNLYIVDNENYNNAVKIITQNSSADRFVTYKWLNPSTNLIEEKISFVRQLPNSDLVIGSGFYLEDINKLVENQRDIELKEHDKNINVTLSLAIVFTLLSFILSYIISKMLLKAFNILHSSLKEKSIELQKLNSELEIKVENRTNKLKTAYKKMKDLASIDDLTKIYNRYYFFNIFNQQLEKLKSDKTIFSLIMFDLDHFKNVNDTYGHDVGDYVLNETCRVVEKCLREDDTFARIGGEEFLISLPNTNIEDAFYIAQRIRQNIEQHKFKDISKLTISLGVAEANEPILSTELLKKVDLALYKAKKEGRNKVIAFKN